MVGLGRKASSFQSHIVSKVILDFSKEKWVCDEGNMLDGGSRSAMRQLTCSLPSIPIWEGQ